MTKSSDVITLGFYVIDYCVSTFSTINEDVLLASGIRIASPWPTSMKWTIWPDGVGEYKGSVSGSYSPAISSSSWVDVFSVSLPGVS